MASKIMHTLRWWWPNKPNNVREVTVPRDEARDLRAALSMVGWTVESPRAPETVTRPHSDVDQSLSETAKQLEGLAAKLRDLMTD